MSGKSLNGLLFCVLMMMWFIPLSAGANTYTNGIYTFDDIVDADNDVAISCYDISVSGDVIIPSEIDGFKVTAVREFIGCSRITSITIPVGVTEIGYRAFENCTGLESVTLPGSLQKIDNQAFSGCTSLKSIIIPDSVTSLGSSAFWGCTGLEEIKLSENIKVLESCVLSNCRSLENIELPEGITHIMDNAFNGCEVLESITLPESLTYIGNAAFVACHYKLIDITIPKNVTYIGDNVFNSCFYLTDINVDEENEMYTSLDGVLFDKEKTELIRYPQGKGRIYQNGVYTFPCNLVYSVPDGVKNIRRCAFYNCTTLSEINIPASTVSIGESAFEVSGWLKAINVAEDNSVYASVDGILFNKEKTVLLHFPTMLTAEYTIPDGVTSIAESAFSHNSNITGIKFPQSITCIGESSFNYCTKLTSVALPEKVTEIPRTAFFYCKNMRAIYIPKGITHIYDHVFTGCDSLSVVYYGGDENDWENVNVEDGNESLSDAIIVYNAVSEMLYNKISIQDAKYLEEDGTITITFDIEETFKETGDVIVALYSKNRLVDSALINEENSTEYVFEGVQQSTEGYNVRIFAWDGISSMKPLTLAEELAVE